MDVCEASHQAQIDHLTVLIQERVRRASHTTGQVTSLAQSDDHDLSASNSRYSPTPTQQRLRRRRLPDLAVRSGIGSGMLMSAVGEVGDASMTNDPASSPPVDWTHTLARTLVSLLSAHEYCGTYLAWSSLGDQCARTILLDPQTIMIESGSPPASSKVSAAEYLSSSGARIPPGDGIARLTNFVDLGLDLLAQSQGRIPPLPATVTAILAPNEAPSLPRPIPLPTPATTSRRRLRRSPGTPPLAAPSPPRMAINDLSTPPRSTSPLKRSSPGYGGSPGKRPAIDVHAWRKGMSGAALFDRCSPERCCSPTELDTPPPSDKAESEEADAEATLRPGALRLAAEATIRPGTLAPAWGEDVFGPLPTPAAAEAGPSGTNSGSTKLSAEDYVAALGDLRLILVSSTQMDAAVEAIRKSLR